MKLDNQIAISTRISIRRNFSGFPLGPGLDKHQRLKIMGKLHKVCKSLKGDLKGTFYPLENMDNKTRHKLGKDNLLLKEGDRFQHASNLNQDWPSGRGVFHNDAKSLLVWVNGEDQLQLISM